MAGDPNDAGAGDREQPDLQTAAELSEDPMGFILVRARSEVHLLLDNISANPETTIGALASAKPPKGLADNWLEEVCRITWPPSKEDAGDDKIAENAALLIRAKDYLNSLAKPASGATIAFTLMVTQEDDAQPPAQGENAKPEDPATAASRTSLATAAYPDLQPKARAVRSMTRLISRGLIVWLAVTLLLSWYVTVGNSALGDLAAARQSHSEAATRVTAAQSSMTVSAAVRTDESVPGAPGTAGAPNAAPANPVQTGTADSPAPARRFLTDPCAEERQARATGPASLASVEYESVELMQACSAFLAAEANLRRVEQGLDRWALFWGDASNAGWGINLIAATMLPVFYGLLGAIASVVRSLSRKIKASILSPRDLQLSAQQLALGAVIGACISLFTGPSDGGETSLMGSIALSSSAISFVAGFGVESVFLALEALIARIFNVAPPGSGAAGRDAARRSEPLSTE